MVCPDKSLKSDRPLLPPPTPMSKDDITLSLWKCGQLRCVLNPRAHLTAFRTAANRPGFVYKARESYPTSVISTNLLRFFYAIGGQENFFREDKRICKESWLTKFPSNQNLCFKIGANYSIYFIYSGFFFILSDDTDIQW